jgi:hypothetical protein
VADSALFELIPVQNLMPKDIADPTTFWISLFCWQKQSPQAFNTRQCSIQNRFY